jgi:hypothetical protein
VRRDRLRCEYEEYFGPAPLGSPRAARFILIANMSAVVGITMCAFVYAMRSL